MKARQTGFTLVEIAIVLVIIGLLLGGILKGQEMITQAKIKNVIADFSGVSAAYHGYQDRYRAIPGDDPNAATRWAVAPVATAGDGHGVVGGLYNTAADAAGAAGESRRWWDHLRRAGFVSGTGTQQPFNALTGMIGFWATLSLNIPDFSRYARSLWVQVIGQALGLPLTMALYAFIGVAVTSATTIIYGETIWDPVDVLTRFTNPVVLIVAMIALVVALVMGRRGRGLAIGALVVLAIWFILVNRWLVLPGVN